MDKLEVEEKLNKLFEFKERLHIKNKNLSEFLNVSPRTIYRWENRETIPLPVYFPMIDKIIELMASKFSEKRINIFNTRESLKK